MFKGSSQSITIKTNHSNAIPQATANIKLFSDI